MRYFTNISNRGPLKYRDVPGSIGVLQDFGNHMPVGQADCRGPDDSGRAVFRLRVGGQQIAGEWIIVDGEFVRAGT